MGAFIPWKYMKVSYVELGNTRIDEINVYNFLFKDSVLNSIIIHSTLGTPSFSSQAFWHLSKVVLIFVRRRGGWVRKMLSHLSLKIYISNQNTKQSWVLISLIRKPNITSKEYKIMWTDVVILIWQEPIISVGTPFDP